MRYIIAISLLFFVNFLFGQESALVIQQGHSDEILMVSVDPLGKTYATASRDKTVKVWDLRSGKLIKTVTGFSFYVTKVGYSPEGGFLYMRGDLGTCKVFSTSDFSEVTTKFYDDFFPITQLTFGVNDDMLLFGIKGSAFVVNTKTWNKHLMSGRVAGEVDQLIFNKDTKKVSVRAKGGSPTDIDISPILAKEKFSIDRIPSERYPYSAVINNDLVEISDQKAQVIAKRKQPKVSIPVNAVFSKDNSFVAVSFDDQPNVMLWSLKSNAMIRINVGSANNRAMLFLDNSTELLVGAGNELRSYWVNGELNKVLFSTGGKINAIGMSPDKKFLIAGTADGNLVLYDNLLGKVISTTKIGETITSISVHPKGKMIAVAEDGHVGVFKFPSMKEDYIAIKGTATRCADYSGDGKYLMAQDAKTKRIMLFESGKEEAAKSFNDPSEHKTKSESAIRSQVFPVAFSKKNSYMISMGEEWVMHLRSSTDFSVTELKGHSSWANSFYFSPDDRFLISTSEDGSVQLWDVAKKSRIGLMIFNQKDYVVATADNFYFTSKGGYDMVGFFKNGKVYPFEQFDVILNRPDKVLKQFGCVNDQLILAYEKAWNKRLEKLGFKSVNTTGTPPELQILNRDKIAINTKASDLKISLSANGNGILLDRLLVWINDVPIWGKNGLSLKKANAADLKKEISINLANGINTIDVAVMNINGVESARERIITDYYPATTALPKLFFVGIGSSKFKTTAFDLNYPAKDVEDLNQFLSGLKGTHFSEVSTKLYLNDKVDVSILKEIKSHFSQAGRNDIVVLFFAGHGVLDVSYNYYLSAYNMDFNAPANGGIEYQKLESVLDSIAPLKKLFFIDACHSGEVDKEEMTFATNTKTEKSPDVNFRNVGQGLVQKGGLGLPLTSELLKELFADLRRGTGATVISSAGAVEFAMESGAWKNGLFSYCLLNGLKDHKADLDRNGKVSISEILKYVSENVAELSGGKQNPTSRAENISIDFELW